VFRKGSHIGVTSPRRRDGIVNTGWGAGTMAFAESGGVTDPETSQSKASVAGTRRGT
jgi:hypothetical protein